MKFVSETKALERVTQIKDELRSEVAVYENKARACSECRTQGSCCLDAHFVNVRISQLEAVAIARALSRMPAVVRAGVASRAQHAIDTYGLEGSHDRTFACPLFQKGIGCLVHNVAKPVPCIVHACYDRPGDLPPDELANAAELAISRVEARTYGRTGPLTSLPIAVRDALT